MDKAAGTAPNLITEATKSTAAAVTLPRTVYGGTLRRQLRSQAELAAPRVQPATMVFLALNFGWAAAFVLAESLKDSVPWTLTFLSCTGITIAVSFGTRWINSLNLFRMGDNRWATFPGSLSLSSGMFSVIFLLFAFVHHFAPDHTLMVNRQVVDIELVSPKDYQDRKDIAPSTIKQERVATDKNTHKDVGAPSVDPVVPQPVAIKHTAPTIAVAHQSASSTQPPPQKPTRQPSFVIRQQPDVVATTGIATPPKEVPKAKPAPPAKPRDNSPLTLEEVAPAQLMEVTDQPEDNGEVSQNGGHSHGGTGSQTLLVSYLNDIHRRLKKAWTPPEGETRSAKILFRIMRNGRLASMKLVDSFGKFESDQSAMKAVASSQPFKPLPADYPSEYLDLLYTFKYTADELSEVNSVQTY